MFNVGGTIAEQALFLVGLGLLIIGGFVRSPWDEICLAVGIVVFGLGSALFVGGFFALMSPISQYDAILLVCGLMVVSLVVTLGLVPSVMRKEKTRAILVL